MGGGGGKKGANLLKSRTRSLLTKNYYAIGIAICTYDNNDKDDAMLRKKGEKEEIKVRQGS
jgi:peptidyl-tRNA hydrolase